jgi:hypothetical protein
MPGRKTHVRAGALSGAMYAGYRARNQAPIDQLVETLAGAVGGSIAGVLPDVLEPAVSSWHRSTGHSCAAGVAILSSRNLLANYEAYCRDKAARCRPMRTSMVLSPQGRVLSPAPNSIVASLAELFWRFLAGCLNGMAAGYVSHLVLDAGQPRSIPLLTRGL